MNGSLDTSQASAIVRLDAVGVSYESRNGAAAQAALVESFSLTVQPGEVVCLRGRSGSGKSSLLRIASGLQRPDFGYVEWGERRLDALSKSGLDDLRRRHVSYVDQDASLLGELSVAENIGLAAPRTKGPRSDIAGGALSFERIVDDLRIAPLLAAKPATLSGGERQRAALARSLLAPASLYVFDEPTASLDATLAQNVTDVFDLIGATGAGVLLASHDAHVLEWADRVVPIGDP
ncbi:ABC transporter ATP-binding protein [Citricoccus sp. NR2]|uniref:ABC transporter ATP-binding protein n=1 Tax=Citricoccus sp. NR2 TaxID=3004095 RepID=UPI0022DDCB22|nr:ATP-binding cassette domain-containing protein [Citricoccus sp. NR2]WBL20052.1 ATP-binding cassette domain-containing protein [Citricoccus sp. NR2]